MKSPGWSVNIIKRLFGRSTADRYGSDNSSAEAPLSIDNFDPQSNAFIQNPYPMLQLLRQQAPVLRLSNGSWVLSRHEDILSALADHRLGNSPSPFAVVNERHSHKYSCAAVANNTLPFLDAPEHTAIRQAIAKLFMQQLTSSKLDLLAMVRQRLQRLGDKPFDLLEDFSSPLCVQVMAALFGFDGLNAQHERQLKDWSTWFFYLFSIIPDEETLARLNLELDAFREFMAGHLHDQSAATADNLSAGLLLLAEQFPEFSEQQMIDNSLLLMADGVNADFGIANAVLTLAQHPRQFDQLHASTQLGGAAAAELLRFESPSLFIARRALEDLEVAGQTIRKNSGVLLMLASANHDESVFEHPDELDFKRKSNPHLTFGKGAHACIGRVLVLNLVKAVIQCLAEEVDQIELVGDAPRWDGRAGHRWLVDQSIRLSWRR